MSKNLLIVCDPLGGHITYKIRGVSMMPLLDAMGWNTTILDIRSKSSTEILESASKSDLVYLLKIDSLPLVKAIKSKCTCKVIFDLTDALWMPHFKKDGWNDLNDILSSCDAVFCCNDFDSKYALSHNKKVFVIPPYANIDEFDRQINNVNKDANQVTIGWVGSNGTSFALTNIKDALIKTSRRFNNVRLLLIGCNDQNHKSMFGNMEVVSYPDGYDEKFMIENILKMDIGIYPLTRNEEDFIIRGPLKMINYMAGRIPVISYNAGACSKIIDDNVNGMLARTSYEWENKLSLLVSNSSLRKDIGERGYQTIKFNFSKEQVSKILNYSLQEVLFF